MSRMAEKKRRAVYRLPLMIRAVVYVGSGFALIRWGGWIGAPVPTIAGGVLFIIVGARCAWKAARIRITRKDVERLTDPFSWG